MPNNFLTLVIQARMNSTRFPNKVMSDLSGAPLIERILQRVKRVKKIRKIIINNNNQTRKFFTYFNKIYKVN